MKRILSMLVCSLVCAIPAAVVAQTAYPTKPAKLVVGFAPGGGNDILARLMAEHFQKSLGQPFVVENRSGASGMIAIEAVKNAAPDGYTLLVGPSSGMAVNPTLFSKINYDPVKDFVPIAIMGDIPMVITVNPASKAKTLAEFVQMARNSPNPLHVGSAATSFQLASAVFANKAGIALENVNYRGSALVVTAMLANEVEIALIDAAAVLPQIRAGKLRALAVTGSARFSQLPDVPTAVEAGVPGFTMSFWSALFAPAGTPAPVVSALQASVRQGVQIPEVAQRLKELGIEPIGSTSEELTRVLARDLLTYKEAAKMAKVVPE